MNSVLKQSFKFKTYKFPLKIWFMEKAICIIKLYTLLRFSKNIRKEELGNMYNRFYCDGLTKQRKKSLTM